MEIRTEQDIINLILAREERLDVDYKIEIDLNASDHEKARLAKDVIAMANSRGGGLLIGGVAPKGHALQGMSQSSLIAFDSTRLNEFVAKYSDPPINARTRRIDIKGKTFGVIIIPEFDHQPHIVIKDAHFPTDKGKVDMVLTKGDLLVRTARNSSERAGPHELRDLIGRAVSRRQDFLRDMLQVYLEDRRATLVGAAKPEFGVLPAPFDKAKYEERYKGFRKVTLSPVNERISARPMALRSAAERAVVGGYSRSQEFPPGHFSSQVERRLPIGIAFEHEPETQQHGQQRLSFAFFDINGGVLCVASLWEDIRYKAEDGGAVGVFSIVEMIFGSLLFARRYYPALDFEGEIVVRFSLESSVPRELVADVSRYETAFIFEHYYTDVLPVVVDRTIRTDADLESLEGIAKDMITEFFWYFDFDLQPNVVNEYLDYVKQHAIRIPRDLLPNQDA